MPDTAFSVAEREERHVGRLLAAARSWWMERGCVDDADACRAKLHELAAVGGI